jgi:hypothetical protein
MRLFLTVALMLLLTACGGGDPEDQEPDVQVPGRPCQVDRDACK